MKTTYWKTDFNRCFFSLQIVTAVCGVCAIHMMIPKHMTEIPISVLHGFNNSWSSNAMVLAYIFTTFAYGQCFTEDLETGYINYALIRGKASHYVISKCICIVLAAEISMVFGRLFFALFLRCFLPWEAKAGEMTLLCLHDSFSRLLESGHYLWYLLIHGFVQGIWAAVLALLSAFVSFFTRNKLLVLAFPVMTHHFIRRIVRIVNPSGRLDPDRLFLINYNVCGEEEFSFAMAFVIGAGFWLLLGVMIYQCVKRRKYE